MVRTKFAAEICNVTDTDENTYQNLVQVVLKENTARNVSLGLF